MGEADPRSAVSAPRLASPRSTRELTLGSEPVWRPGSLEGPYRVAEAIASKDLNNLYRTSCYFADSLRYEAFCAFYAVMRVVDDRVDEIVARRRLTDAERHEEHSVLDAWCCTLAEALVGRVPTRVHLERTRHPDAAPLVEAFADAARKFPLPAFLWDRFFMAMRRDLELQRFATYRDFVAYANGAAVSPTAIYLHVIAAEYDQEIMAYRPPPAFALIPCAHELGLFAYLGHILRDLAKDLDHGLLYLSAEDMAQHGVTEENLAADLLTHSAEPGLKSLTRDLSARAARLLVRGRARLAVLQETLSPDRVFVLEAIVRIYEGVLAKIAMQDYDVVAGRHRLTDGDKQAIVKAVLEEVTQRSQSAE